MATKNKDQRVNGSKKIAIAMIVFVSLLLISGISVIFFYRPYTAVHLSNGALYFGKARMFPGLALTDVYMLQTGTNGVVSLQKMKDVLWKPGDELKINEDQIIFTARLADDSPIIKAIKGEVVPGALTEAEMKQLEAEQQSAGNNSATGDQRDEASAGQ